MSEIKEKTVTGLLWSAIENFANIGIQFIIGIILARLVAPKEFGLIGMITIFIAISHTFIEGGFMKGLIRKTNVSDVDYSTAFFYNLAVGCLLYLILFLSAEVIARFYSEPELKALIRVLGINLIIGSFTIVQSAILIRRIDFKMSAKIKVTSAIVSGSIAIYLAYQGFGVWSLVFRVVLERLFTAILLWFWNSFFPSLVFSIASFKELFGYGSKLLISGLIHVIFTNIYLVIIGKFFSPAELGYYVRADKFNNFTPVIMTNIIATVTFPVFSQMRHNIIDLKAAYKRMLKTTMLWSFCLSIGMVVVAEPMILSLIGEVWKPSIIYLQMLCFIGMIYPLSALNLNVINVFGRSDLFLKLEVIKKILTIPIIFIGIIWGIKAMILGMWVNTLFGYYLNSYYSGLFINYPIREQLRDIIPSLLFAMFMGVFVALTGYFLPLGNLAKLIIQVTTGILIVYVVGELIKFDAFIYTKKIIKEKILSVYNARK